MLNHKRNILFALGYIIIKILYNTHNKYNEIDDILKCCAFRKPDEKGKTKEEKINILDTWGDQNKINNEGYNKAKQLIIDSFDKNDLNNYNLNITAS